MKRWCLPVLVAAVAATAQPPAAGQSATPPRPLRVIAFSPHADAAEIQASGVVASWGAQGHKVKFVAMTDPTRGHAEDWRDARHRAHGFGRCGRILGIETQRFNRQAGWLTPSPENHRTVARLIRQWQADIVLGPRPYDEAARAKSVARSGDTGDPDYRALGSMVEESAATVVDPSFLPDTPPLPRSPVYLYYDNYQRPPSFEPTIVAGVDAAAEKKWKCIQAMTPGATDMPPLDAYTHRKLRVEDAKRRGTNFANTYRDLLVAWYGAERGQQIRYAEVFEPSRQGRQATVEELQQLFPK